MRLAHKAQGSRRREGGGRARGPARARAARAGRRGAQGVPLTLTTSQETHTIPVEALACSSLAERIGQRMCRGMRAHFHSTAPAHPDSSCSAARGQRSGLANGSSG